MAKIKQLCLGLYLVLFAAACGPTEGAGSGSGTGDPGDSPSAPDAGPQEPSPPPGSGAPDDTDTPVSLGCESIDLVFVIDDSISMGQEQRNLIDNFPAFIEVLDNYRVGSGEPLDYRVAVTTTGRNYERFIITNSDGPQARGESEGDNGRFRQDCGMTRPWIERSDSNVSQTFSCVANVGVGGPVVEMPLGSLERALDGTNPGQDDFTREDALLAVVILTDEDDCSVTGDRHTADRRLPNSLQCVTGSPLELSSAVSYIDFLDQVKGDPDRWAAAVIAGPGPETCSSEFGSATPANRLLEFTNAKAPRSSFSSICDGDLSLALQDALETFDEACQGFPPID